MKTFCLSFISIVVLFTFFSVQSVSGQTIQEPLHVDLSKTLGFIMGQRFSLNRITDEYPYLCLRAQKANLEFKAAFGIAEENINKALQDMLKDKYSESIAMMEKKLKSTLSSQQLNQDIAAQFLDEVESRAKGNVPSPILEILLTYQFKDRPAEEFTKGYNCIFRTKGHPKAKGVDFQIRYPISWRPNEGERPNIIQKFTSKNGRGLEMFLIMVKDIPLPPGYILTQKDLYEFFVESELRGMVPDGGKFISAKPVVLDNHKGAMILFDQSVQRLDLTLTMRNLHFITIRGNKMIFIQCMIFVTPNKESNLQEKFSRFEPLFKMIANSFVIQEQYK